MISHPSLQSSWLGPSAVSLAARASQEAKYAIGLDIGGTKIAGGVVAPSGQVVGRVCVPTPSLKDGSATLNLLRQVIDRLREQCSAVQAIGVGAAGMIDWPSGRIRWAPNNSYHDLPLRALLSEETGLPTVVDNDANVAAWAEARLGAGVGYRHLAVLTVGTGIGAGLVLDGRLYRGPSGIGGEVGHIIVFAGGDRCGCGNTGCLEAMASGAALGRAGRDAASRDPKGMLAKLAAGAENVTGAIVFEAARVGDPTARSLFTTAGYWLGVGIASLVTLFDVELVVIAGGLSATGDLLLTSTRASYERFVFARAHRELAPIICAQLGPEAGMIGAAILALDQLEDPPTHAIQPAKGVRLEEKAR
jgi:glucokinase